MCNTLTGSCQRAVMRLDKLAGRLDFYAPDRQLDRYKQYLDEVELRLESLLTIRHSRAVRKLDNLATALSALDPSRQLERGYAMVFQADGKTLVTSSKQPSGSSLNVRFADGTLEVKSL